MLCVLCVCWSDCETSVEKSARFTYILQMSLALPGRKVHLTSIVKQNEGCMYIGVANILFDTLSLRILLPSALMRGNLIRFAIMCMYNRTCACTCVGHA